MPENRIMIQKNGKPGKTRSRRGITLIEVLVLVTGVAVMLGLCAVTIQLLLRLHADSQARVSSTIVLERLAGQLRNDAHASESARLSASGARAPEAGRGLTLNMKADHSISYVVGEHVVARDETQGGKRIRHESYSLERGQTARFELIDESGHKMVALWVTQEPGKSRVEPPKPLEVLASLGKHRPRAILMLEGSKP
jgi:type II secretory pathway component PulJ